MTIDVGKSRAAYPALADGHAYLGGAAGTQLPNPVIDAITGAYRVRDREHRRRVPGQPPLRDDHR
ncbi:MAG TPA: hypothetical protein VMC83_36465 [Streptosporangiaceae bacterium]|nr:hypothetical protein [Streptosporangiaceae bacterium]